MKSESDSAILRSIIVTCSKNWEQIQSKLLAIGADKFQIQPLAEKLSLPWPTNRANETLGAYIHKSNPTAISNIKGFRKKNTRTILGIILHVWNNSDIRQGALKRNWTREETLLALNLYHQTAFGKQHKAYPPIIELAERIGRTPSSVAMKLNNFTSLDPVEKMRGIKGLQGASILDRDIWAEFSGNLEKLAEKTEPLFLPEEKTPDGPTETSTLTKNRLYQSFFRRTVLGSYGERCCITGNPVPQLLRASHIIPWAKSKEYRLDPSNGLCLAATHDAAFDQGFITLDEEYRLILSDTLREFLPNAEIRRAFIKFEGKRIRLPDKNTPSRALLEWHRENIFVR
jgi:predicted restriction endonuclease